VSECEARIDQELRLVCGSAQRNCGPAERMDEIEGAEGVRKAIVDAHKQAAWLDEEQSKVEGAIEAYEDLILHAKALKERVQAQKRARDEMKKQENAQGPSSVNKRNLDDRPEALVDLGCGVFSKARIDEPELLSVCIGAGVYVDLTLEEVEKVVNRRISLLREECAMWMRKRGEVYGHERILQEAQQILNYVSGLSDEERQALM